MKELNTVKRKNCLCVEINSETTDPLKKIFHCKLEVNRVPN